MPGTQISPVALIIRDTGHCKLDVPEGHLVIRRLQDNSTVQFDFIHRLHHLLSFSCFYVAFLGTFVPTICLLNDNLGIISGDTVVTDLFDMSVLGKFVVRRYSDTTLNTPYKAGVTSATGGLALCYFNSVNNGHIVAYTAGSGGAYQVTLGNGVWSDWHKIATKSDLESKAILTEPNDSYIDDLDTFLTLNKRSGIKPGITIHTPDNINDFSSVVNIGYTWSSFLQIIIDPTHNKIHHRRYVKWLNPIWSDWVVSVTNADLAALEARIAALEAK